MANSTCRLNSRLMRWSLFLQDFDFEILYVAGEDNIGDWFSIYINSVRADEPRMEEKLTLPKQYHIKSGHGSDSCLNFLVRNRFE